ncbi:hypothetical protein U9R62_03830 [Cylindrospermopsis raciborskii DSH]|uniref:hypothetical protein n=1 Tax=Cylindrospermopsis raciborskii TaxID=77022 RepID=UPI002ED91E81
MNLVTDGLPALAFSCGTPGTGCDAAPPLVPEKVFLPEDRDLTWFALALYLPSLLLFRWNGLYFHVKSATGDGLSPERWKTMFTFWCIKNGPTRDRYPF